LFRIIFLKDKAKLLAIFLGYFSRIGYAFIKQYSNNINNNNNNNEEFILRLKNQYRKLKSAGECTTAKDA